MERMRAHLAWAEGELEAALRFLDPKSDDEAEIDLVRAVANARTSVGDALETIRASRGAEVGGWEMPFALVAILVVLVALVVLFAIFLVVRRWL